MHVQFLHRRIPVVAVVLAVCALTSGAFYFFNRTNPSEAAVQTGYRWRNDDGTEATATFSRAEGQPLTVRAGDADRLRLAAANSGTESEFVSVGSVTFAAGEDSPIVGAIDAANGFAYVGTQTSPAKVVKIRLSDMTEVDSLTVGSAVNLTTAAIDAVNGFAYFGTATNPGKIVKVDLSSFTVSSVLTLAHDAVLSNAFFVDETNGFLYVGDADATVVKIDLASFTEADALPVAEQPWAAAFDAANGIAYFGSFFNSPGLIVKVDLASFTVADSLDLPPGQESVDALDIYDGFLYDTVYADPGVLAKIDLASFTETDTLTFGDLAFPDDMAIDTQNGFAYVNRLDSTTGKIAKVDLSTFSFVTDVAAPGGDSEGLLLLDETAGYLYQIEDKVPGSLDKFSIAPRADFRLEYGEKATSCAAIADWSAVPGGNLGMEANDVAVFDTEPLNAEAVGFGQAASDGRYIYYVPYFGGAGGTRSGTIARYDTEGGFTDSGSWSFFDATTVDPDAEGFVDAVFDGRYVYFVANFSDNGESGVMLRYDTTAAFGSVPSYTVFDTSVVSTEAVGYTGATFDGRYLYLARSLNTAGTDESGIVVRYDTTASFTDPGSWDLFDLSNADPEGKGYATAVFDGQYVYFIPVLPVFQPTVKFARYDTSLPFGDVGSYQFFDTATVQSDLRGYSGGAFDGRYLYFAPAVGGPGASQGKVLRFDTTASFTTGSSWDFFDMAAVSPDSETRNLAQFDGRYAYFLPDSAGNGTSKTLMRYDTTEGFSDASSWSAFDLTTADPDAVGFFGGVVEGGYLYLAAGFDNSFAASGNQTRVFIGDAWEMADSTNLTDAGATTNVAGGLTDGNVSFKPGEAKDLNAQTNSLSLGELEFTELEYSLHVTDFAPQGTDYCFRLTDAGDASAFTFNNYGEASIRVASSGGGGGGGGVVTPSVTVTDPNGGETLAPGSMFPITWNTSGRVDLVNIAYSADNGTNWNAIATNTFNTGTFSWTVPDVATSQARVRVEATDTATVFASDVSDSTFTITGTQPPPGSQQPVPAGTLVLSPFSGLPEAVDTVHVGDYVRSPHYRGIYYVTDQFVRRPFSYASLFFTYETDLSKVREVSDATLSTLPEKSAMPPKAGTVLLRFDGEPGIYGVFPGPNGQVDPLLRHIDSESLAVQLYGPAWKSYVLDLDNLFFGDYSLASPLITFQHVPTSGLLSRDYLHAKVVKYMAALMKAGYSKNGSLPLRRM